MKKYTENNVISSGFFLGATPLFKICVAPKVGGAGVALEVDEIAPLKTPLCTPLACEL